MIGPRAGTDRGSRIQLLAIILVTLLVMVLGILVVVAPERMGVPQPVATPTASPSATAEEG
jgi:predicted cobalt transporter CbtA